MWANMAVALPAKGEATHSSNGDTPATRRKPLFTSIRGASLSQGKDGLRPESQALTGSMRTIRSDQERQPSIPAEGTAQSTTEIYVTYECHEACVCSKADGGGLQVECTKPGTLLTLPDLGPENENVMKV